MTHPGKKKVIIVGGGFAGLEAAKGLMDASHVDVVLIDRTNHHLFQPLLYQVALAELSPADIATPIRTVLSKARNTRVVMDEVTGVALDEKKVLTKGGGFPFDYLVLACGSSHSYFGNNQWEDHAPGLKTLPQALEIRKRVLCAFEQAEREDDPETKKKLLTFIIVGGGPTGVELAGALAELRRFTLAKDFQSIDPRGSEIHLIEAGPRLLPAYSPDLSEKAKKDLEEMGVTVHVGRPVTEVKQDHVKLEDGRIDAQTILWAAGVVPSPLNKSLEVELDRGGRILVEKDLSMKDHRNIFVVGDQAGVFDSSGKPLPALAPVAVQEGKHVAQVIREDSQGQPRSEFEYADRGMMATIGRARAVLQRKSLKLSGPLAWLLWVFVHIYFLIGFRNRVLVLLQWVWNYATFRKGARLIVPKQWQLFDGKPKDRS